MSSNYSIEYLDKLDEEINYLKNSLIINNDNKIILSIIERMEQQQKLEQRKYRLCFWNEYKYIKAKEEIYNKIMMMKKEGRNEIEKDDYFKLLYEYKELHQEQEELLVIEKKAKKEAKKVIEKLWKEQSEIPIKSFCVSV